MSGHPIQLLALFGAFWTAIALYAERSPAPAPARFVGALGLGAVFAHLGWAVLHWPAVAAHPSALLDPARGLTVLFVPLGLLFLERSPAAFASLPLALAVARLGCLAAGCCHGPGGEPTPLYEIGGLVALHGIVRRLPARWVTPTVLAGFGLIRLATEPLRAMPPLGATLVPAAHIAAGWVVLGGLGAIRRLSPAGWQGAPPAGGRRAPAGHRRRRRSFSRPSSSGARIHRLPCPIRAKMPPGRHAGRNGISPCRSTASSRNASRRRSAQPGPWGARVRRSST